MKEYYQKHKSEVHILAGIAAVLVIIVILLAVSCGRRHESAADSEETIASINSLTEEELYEMH